MRTLVACIVALCIPLQGLAATVMAHCAAGHAHASGMAEHTSITHQSEATVSVSHHSTHDQVDGHASAHDDSSSTSDRTHCAVCCAALITQMARVVTPVSPVGQPAPAVMPVATDRYPGGIERPPRFAHA